MDELVDVRDGGSGERTGEVVWKSEAHRLGLWHRCFHCWVFGTGEEPLDGLREVEEELGLRVDPGRLAPLGTRRIEQRIAAGLDREIHDVFLLRDDSPPEDLRLQEEEVEAVLRIGLDDAVLLETAGSAPAREYREREASETRVPASDFVPNTDDYLRRVALAARDALGGGRVERIF